MKLLCFIYFLFFYLIFIHCECDYSKLLPGIIRASSGIDITELNFLPNSVFEMLKDSGFKKSLIALTCNHPRHFKNPFLLNSSPFLVPDQIAGINLEPNGQFSEMVNTRRSYDTMSQMIELGGGLSFDTQGYGAYSFGGGYGNMESSLSSKNITIVEMTAMALAYSIDFKPYVVTKKVDRFYKMVKKLKGQNYTANYASYHELFKEFGTHYFTSAKFGGYVRFRTLISSEYYNTTSQKEIYAYVGAGFKRLINVKLSLNDSVKINEQTFDEQYKKEVRYYGGPAKIIDSPMNISAFNDWIPGVEKNPYLFDGKLESITNLIDDETVLKEVEIAMLAKVTKKYLNSMKKILDLVPHYNERVGEDIDKCLEAMVPQLSGCNISEIQSQMTKLINKYHPNPIKTELLGSSLGEFELQNSLRQEMHDLYTKKLNLLVGNLLALEQTQTSNYEAVK